MIFSKYILTAILVEAGEGKKMKEKTCCFTGHRDIPQENLLHVKQALEARIIALIEHGYLYFGVGGAVGFDTLAAETLFMLKKTKYPYIKVILVYPFDGYTHYWTVEQQEHHKKLLPQYDKIVCASDTPGKSAYLARNRRLVDDSSCCICYLTRDDGGTAYTVRYARVNGLKLYNTAPN